MVRSRIAAAALATVLLGAAMPGVLAQDATPVAEEATEAQTTEAGTAGEQTNQVAAAAALVAVIVQAADTIDIEDSNIEVITVEIEDSLNNLDILNDVEILNDSLNENNIVIRDVITIEDIDALIAIGILDGGDLILFTTE